jgi:putative endonuclease
MNELQKFGFKGEDIAATFLTNKGYKIRHRNWRAHHIELDIIAENDDYIVVVEVKTRRNDKFSHPSDAVNRTKIKHIVNATQAYIFKYNINKDVRFDIISIIPTLDGNFEIEHQEDAFYPPMGR